jgi:hypothetical protein
VADQNAARAAPRYADGGPARKGELGGLPPARDLIGTGSAALTIDFIQAAILWCRS